MKAMSSRYIRGVSMLGYGVSLAVGIGIPIPIIDEEMMRFVSVSDGELFAPVIDYSKVYPNREGGVITRVSYSELKSGEVTIRRKKVVTASLSSYFMAREIAETLRGWIRKGSFLITEKVASLPGVESGQTFKPMPMRPENDE
jgi:L-aspartate semialdehyde sulfurtransferase